MGEELVGVAGAERLSRLRLGPFTPAAAGSGVASTVASTVASSLSPALTAAPGVRPGRPTAPDQATAAAWAVPGVRLVTEQVMSPVVQAVVQAVDVLASAPRTGSPVDVAAVLSLAERLRGVGLAELAELAAGGGHLTAGQPSAAVWLRDREGVPLSDVAARARVRLAGRLRDDLPELGGLLRDGLTTLEHVQAVAVGTAGLDRQVVRDSASELCALARSADPATIRAVLSQRVAAVRPELAEQVAARRHERRGLYADEVLGDHVAVAGTVGIEDGQVLLLGLDLQVEADRQAGDCRSLPQRRADAVVQWAREAAVRLSGPGDSLADDAHSVRSSILVTCTLSQLQALSGIPGTAAARRVPPGPALSGPALSGPALPGPALFGPALPGPALPGPARRGASAGDGDEGVLLGVSAPPSFPSGSPLTGQALRRLACDATLTLLVGPAGSAADLRPGPPLYVGRATRTVSGTQFKALVRRDRHCVVKGCRRRPAQCEAHHVRHWADGGATDLDNLVLLCHLHHHDHHDRGHVLQHHDGRWLTASGWGCDPP